MRRLAVSLADRYEVVSVDLPGHGGSALDGVSSFEEAAARIGETGGRAAYVGYSLGGRLVLRLALDRPDLVGAAVVLGARPGIADDEERRARAAADDELADSIVADGVEAFLERWLANPLFATLPPEAAGVEERRANTAAGLAGALRVLSPGRQQPVGHRLAELRPPTLFVAGELDVAFAELAVSMAAEAGAEHALLAGAGHAAHSERPDEFAALVRDFLERTYTA